MSVEDIFDNNNFPGEVKIEFPKKHHNYLINGELKQWNGDFLDIFSPICTKNSKGEFERTLLGTIPRMKEEVSLEALAAAVNAYDFGRGEWPLMKPKERIACIENFVKLMKQKRDSIVKFLMWEIAKSLPESQNEFDRTITYINDTISAYKELIHDNSKVQFYDGVYAKVGRDSLGVVLCLAPYNFPLNETFCMIIPALIMGNTVVYKPAEQGVLFVSELLDAFTESFPKGVINVLFGNGNEVATPIVKTGKINVLALIGNSKSANALLQNVPNRNRLKLVLGLEAKNSAIVLPDADLDKAVAECVLGSLGFNGQRCTAIKMIFVHQSIVERFNQKFIKELEILKYGLPWEEGVKLTPLPQINKPKYLQDLIDDAKNNNAEIINKDGGKRIKSFVYPAVLFPVNDSMRIFHEEQFGPLVPIIPFSDIEEPIKAINKSNYGQQVSLFSENHEYLKQIIPIMTKLVSRVNINSKAQRGPDNYPFTGRKDSAISTLSVKDALETFSINTVIAIKSKDNNKEIIDNIFTDE